VPIVADDVDSPEDFAALIREVKDGIMEVVTAVLIPAGPPQLGEKLPAIKNRRVLDQVPAKYASKVESDRHIVGTGANATKKIHMFMVGYGGLDTGFPSPTVGRKNFRLRFLIDSYYEDDIGTDTDNAEERHSEEFSKVAYALFASKVLNRPSVVEMVMDIQERRGFVRFGERMARESLCELFVKVKAVPLVKP